MWAGEWDRDPGDEEILQNAFAEGRILVTLDKDFGEMAIVLGAPHRGIVRMVDVAARQQGPFCVWLMAKYGADLERGALVTASPKRVRIRPGDSG